jgi:hypothetical protein
VTRPSRDAMVELRLEFRKELCQRPAECFNPRLSLWVV